MIGAFKRVDRVSIAPWSRRWWALWRRDVEAGKDVSALIRAGRRGLPVAVAVNDVVSDIGMVPVNVGSDAWREWMTFYAARGIAMPVPGRAPVVFVAGSLPPLVRSREG